VSMEICGFVAFLSLTLQSWCCFFTFSSFVVRVTLMHLGLKLQALCAPLLVPSFNPRGAPRHAGFRDLC
jgi:hypothetical protein